MGDKSKQNGATAVISATIICLIVGTIGITSGIKMSNTPDRSNDQREELLAAHQQFKILHRDAVSGWTGTAHQWSPSTVSRFTVTENRVVVKGANNQGTDDVTSRYVSAVLESHDFSGQIPVTLNMSFGNTTRSWPMQTTQRRNVVCSKDLCKKTLFGFCKASSRDDEREECSDTSKLAAHCTATYNSLATFHITHGRCYRGEVCGYCEYEAFASTLCAVVDMGPEGETVFIPTKLSCRYPFAADSGVYTPQLPQGFAAGTIELSNSPVTVEIRSSSDPYIKLQEITEGTEEFDDVSKTREKGKSSIIWGSIVLALGILGIPASIIYLMAFGCT